MAKAFTSDVSDYTRSINHLGELNGKTQAENLLRYARTTVSNRQGTGLIQITPPASGGAVGLAARRQGEASIDRDLAAIFVPVVLKGRRRITHVFGRELKRPVYVPTKEKFPYVDQIHAERFRSGRRVGKTLTRGRSQPYYVDVSKVRNLHRQLFDRVGRLSSSIVRAAQALGVPVPGWIARHGGGRGGYRQTLAGPRKLIEITQDVPAHAPFAEVERRNEAAVRYATARIEREIDYLYAQDARRAGFKVI